MSDTCGKCGAAVVETYTLALSWLPEERAENDPGRAELQLCGECADALATNVLVDRAVSRGLDDVYAGVEPGESIDESGEQVVNLADVTGNAEPEGSA